jgi:hypothetical protein
MEDSEKLAALANLYRLAIEHSLWQTTSGTEDLAILTKDILLGQANGLKPVWRREGTRMTGFLNKNPLLRHQLSDYIDFKGFKD